MSIENFDGKGWDKLTEEQIRNLLLAFDLIQNPFEQVCGMYDVKFIRPGDTRSIRSGHVGPCVIMTCRLSDGTLGMAHLNRQDYTEGGWRDMVDKESEKLGFGKGLNWIRSGENELWLTDKSASVEFTLTPNGSLKKTNLNDTWKGVKNEKPLFNNIVFNDK